MSWVTKTDIKLYFGITDTNKDSLIDATIPRVEALIEQYCFRGAGTLWGTFTDVVEYLTAPEESERIFITTHPIFTTLSYVKVRDIQLVADTDYIAEGSSGSILNLTGFWDTLSKCIEVKYSVTNSVPEDIKLAAIEYTGILCNLKSSTYATNEGVEQTVAQGIPDFIKTILETHKVPRFIMNQ